MSAPEAVTSIIQRIASLSATPTAVTTIAHRFGVKLDSEAAAAAAIASDTATATAPAVASTTATGATTSAAAAGARIEVASSASRPTILVSASSAATAASDITNAGPMPVGTWVDRIPNARGKALAPAIAAAAKKYSLDPELLAAVFWTESSYTPDVVSRTGAIGLGQLMPETAEWLKVDPWDPMQNIDGSAHFYRYLLDRNHGDLSLAIASYAAGPGAVKAAGGIPDQFTANYVTKLTGRIDYLAGRRSTAP